ncbi:MAG: thiamine pyrophosphate-binding protein [Dongiaceae bacterium]
MTAWRAVAEALAAESVRHIFGLPGNPLHLVEDVEAHTDIDIVLVRQEHSGVACAYAYARLTGGPAVCFGNPGPGITNMVTGLLEATSGCLPVICLTNGVPLADDGKGAFQELDSVALMRPVTKWAVRLTRPENAAWVMQRAFTVARNGKPGAVFIDIPSDIGLVEAEIPAYVPSLGRVRSRAEANDVARAAELLGRAKRPLMICGSGAVASGASAEVAALAEALAMPVFTTPGGRGIVGEEEPLAFGQIGLYFSEAGKAYFDRADLVLSVGSRLEDFSTGAWKYLPPRARFIQLDVDADSIGLNVRPEVALVGDAALTLSDLAAALPPADAVGAAKRRDAILKAKRAQQKRVDAEGRAEGGTLRTPQILQALNRIFGHDTIIMHENGGADLWCYYWPHYRVLDVGDSVPMAEQTAMGMGVIGAIAAKLARPDKKVVCVGGDGAMQMAMMELATAAEQRCGITWIVLNNQALGWPQYLQVLEGRKRTATDFAVSPDFAKLAEAQGCRGLRVDRPADIAPALEAALAANGEGVPMLLDCRIPKHDYPPHFTRYHQEVWGLGASGAEAAEKRRRGGGA